MFTRKMPEMLHRLTSLWKAIKGDFPMCELKFANVKCCPKNDEINNERTCVAPVWQADVRVGVCAERIPPRTVLQKATVTDWLAASAQTLHGTHLHLFFFLFFLMQLHYSEQALGSKSIVMSFPDRLPVKDFLRDWGKLSPPSTAMTCRRYATVFPSVRVASVRVAATA